MHMNEQNETMAIGKQHDKLQVRLGGGVLKQVTRFAYLGGLTSKDGRCEEDVRRMRRRMPGMCSQGRPVRALCDA